MIKRSQAFQAYSASERLAESYFLNIFTKNPDHKTQLKRSNVFVKLWKELMNPLHLGHIEVLAIDIALRSQQVQSIFAL